VERTLKDFKTPAQLFQGAIQSNDAMTTSSEFSNEERATVRFYEDKWKGR